MESDDISDACISDDYVSDDYDIRDDYGCRPRAGGLSAAGRERLAARVEDAAARHRRIDVSVEYPRLQRVEDAAVGREAVGVGRVDAQRRLEELLETQSPLTLHH